MSKIGPMFKIKNLGESTSTIISTNEKYLLVIFHDDYFPKKFIIMDLINGKKITTNLDNKYLSSIKCRNNLLIAIDVDGNLYKQYFNINSNEFLTYILSFKLNGFSYIIKNILEFSSNIFTFNCIGNIYKDNGIIGRNIMLEYLEISSNKKFFLDNYLNIYDLNNGSIIKSLSIKYIINSFNDISYISGDNNYILKSYYDNYYHGLEIYNIERIPDIDLSSITEKNLRSIDNKNEMKPNYKYPFSGDIPFDIDVKKLDFNRISPEKVINSDIIDVYCINDTPYVIVVCSELVNLIDIKNRKIVRTIDVVYDGIKNIWDRFDTEPCKIGIKYRDINTCSCLCGENLYIVKENINWYKRTIYGYNIWNGKKIYQYNYGKEKLFDNITIKNINIEKNNTSLILLLSNGIIWRHEY